VALTPFEKLEIIRGKVSAPELSKVLPFEGIFM
jgi:hypothetical protein